MLARKVRSLWSRTGDEEGSERPHDDARGTAGSGSASKLFSCSECDVVYIALEKEVCSSCRGELREVPKTFTHG